MQAELPYTGNTGDEIMNQQIFDTPSSASRHSTNLLDTHSKRHSKQHSKRRAQRFGLFSMLILSALLFTACLPRTMGMQGRLLNSDGTAVSGGVDMVINYWTCANGDENASGCDMVYTETRNNVQVVNGLFDIQLGTTSVDADDEPNPAIFARPLFLEFVVNGETLTPRQRLHGAPYAMSLVGGAVVASLHQGPGGSDGTDENYAALSVLAPNARGTALLVGTGTTNPNGDLIRGCSVLLNVNSRDCSDLRFRVTGDGNVTADGTFTGGGADFAEYLDAVGSPTHYEPGDVLIISPDQDRAVALSTEAYSTAVIGVYSTDPAFMGGGRYLPEDGTTEMLPVGIVGIVPVKVSAENGPIRRGDLLTTSNTPGHAMLASEYAPGAILGKAMGELEEGTGVIEVVLLLQ